MYILAREVIPKLCEIVGIEPAGIQKIVIVADAEDVLRFYTRTLAVVDDEDPGGG